MNALRLNVAGLLKEQAGAVRDSTIDVAPDELTDLLEDARPVAPLVGDLRLMRTPRSVFVRGNLTTQVAIDCSRCLTEVRTPVELPLEAEYFPEIDISSGRALAAPDDDLAFTIDGNHELDLTEIVRQDLLLALPMHTLCSDECLGLCPDCGTNLNQEECTCVPEAADERLTPLRALLQGRVGS
ncbi:MAG: DUF177 domain-containing protein [Chloroflexota bacterium]|nr:DUF177 domain-containing protein [Chloroflexota bacterium]